MNHFREYQDLQMIIRTFEGYHEEFIRISFSRHASGNFEHGKRGKHNKSNSACFMYTK